MHRCSQKSAPLADGDKRDLMARTWRVTPYERWLTTWRSQLTRLWRPTVLVPDVFYFTGRPRGGPSDHVIEKSYKREREREMERQRSWDFNFQIREEKKGDILNWLNDSTGSVSNFNQVHWIIGKWINPFTLPRTTRTLFRRKIFKWIFMYLRVKT